ncbi:DUF885 family protein [Mycoplasma sp. 125]|uniref:DUF885 family protein n=1 Tax=Mycoplasma sp. 125 TaxID=3447505 RepID=UPI003F65849E
MTQKTKKALIITSVVGTLVAAPVIFTVIPFAAQNALFRKTINENKKLESELTNAEAKAVEANVDTKNNIDEKNTKLKDLNTKYNELNDKKSEQATKIAKEIEMLASEIRNLELEYKVNIDNAILPYLAKIAQHGDAKYYDNNYKHTARYIVLSYDKFQRELDDLAANIDIFYPEKEDVDKIVKYYQKWIDLFSKINSNNLNVTTTAWASGLKYDWEIAQTVYASQGRLAGAFYEGGPTSAYPVNSFYKTILRITGDKAEKMQRNLNEGMQANIVLSKVVIKNNVNIILSRHYSKELLEFAKGTQESKSVIEIIDSNKTLDEKTKAFHKFYATEYYKASTTGLGENLEELKVFKSNAVNELENTIEIFDNLSKKVVSIYGLGLTEKDLDAKNVGLSSIPGDEKNTTGKKIYDGILKFATTSNDSAQDVFNSGYETTKTAVKNMELTAKAVARLITGNENEPWTPTIKYDSDGVGPQEVKDVVLEIRDANGNINLPEFYKWLNQEQFFFGRENSSYYTQEKKNELEKDPKLQDAIKNLKNLGYEFLKGQDSKYGSITNDQFYYGALEAFKGYNQFRDTTINEGYSYFPKQVPRYGITTYEYSTRLSSGVGAYNGRAKVEKDGFGAFTFNADPYFGLPKWSVTSFANHESVMGHHNQIYYAQKFLKTVDGLTIGDIFNYTSYKEGWALFMEWFGIEAGLYGTPDFENEDYYALPVSFKSAKGITSFVKATRPQYVTNEEIKGMKELHGGVYWNLVVSKNKIDDDKLHTLKAVELANMLQYFGALNEAQLRNMRRAVDTAYHGDIKGTDDLPAGASINDIRKFLHANSALGIGDITSESKRYLNLPGQATSYNSGKEAMLKLYDRVRKSKGLSREEFVSNKENIKEFLNLLLETGALPLETLKEIVELHYNL